MPRKTMFALLAQADATLPDNTVQAITPANVRQMVKDFIDSVSPGYGVLTHAGYTIVALGLTPTVITYDTSGPNTPGSFTQNAGLGTIVRHAEGLPATVTRVSFNADLVGPNGNEVVFQTFVDGVQAGPGMTITLGGGANFATVSFTGLISNVLGADSIVTIRASKISGGVDDVDIGNVRFICEVVPSIGI